MRKRNLIAAGCMLALSLAMMTGCGSSSSDSGTKAANQSSQNESNKNSGDNSSEDKNGEKPQDDGSKMVQVSKVDGDTVTAVVGEDMRGGGKGPGNGEAPSDGNSNGSDDKQAPPDGNNNGSDDKQAPPDKPDGNSDSDTSSEKGGMPFTATDETMTFKITSETKITTGGRDNQTEATSDDIKESSVLRVTVNDSNEAQTIEIMGGNDSGQAKS